MTKEEYQRRIQEVKAKAHGRWPEILLHLGLDDRMIRKRACMPCPFCGKGTDRFQFTDKYGDGSYFCRKCGGGDGFKLAQQLTGMDFHTLLLAIESYLGMNPVAAQASSARSTQDRLKDILRIWNESRAVTPDDVVGRYLASRGLVLREYPAALRIHPKLMYYRKDGSGRPRPVAEYPAMVACLRDAEGNVFAIQRTYLPHGKKLTGGDAKKSLGRGISGVPVRLYEPTDELAISEGIEKSLAVHLATGKPTWAMLGAGNFEKLWIPDTVTRVSIYADNDADGDFTGQACAFALARRLKREEKDSIRREVRVFVPKLPGVDWSDIWLRRWQAEMERSHVRIQQQPPRPRRAEPRRTERGGAELMELA